MLTYCTMSWPLILAADTTYLLTYLLTYYSEYLENDAVHVGRAEAAPMLLQPA